MIKSEDVIKRRGDFQWQIAVFFYVFYFYKAIQCKFYFLLRWNKSDRVFLCWCVGFAYFEIVSYVIIVFYDKVRGRNKAQRWLLLVCCGFFFWKRYNRTHFHRTILWLTLTPLVSSNFSYYCNYNVYNILVYFSIF
jgi:hypothetical protein